MRTNTFPRLPLLVLLGFALGVYSVGHAQQKDTLGIAAISPTPSLVQTVAKTGKTLSMGRVTESLDSQLLDRFNATRKFQLVAVSDLKELVKKQELQHSGNYDANDPQLAQMFKLAGTKYYLVTTVDDFADFSETATFAGIGKSATKRLIRLSVVGKIYETSTGKLRETANFQHSVKDIFEERQNSTKDGNLSDELLVTIAREMAEKVAVRVADVLYPVRMVGDKLDKQITLNRGDGSGVEVDQIWHVFALGKELKDPDTGEVLGRQEFPVGKVKVISVAPRTSTAEILEDTGIAEGAVFRLPPPKKAPAP